MPDACGCKGGPDPAYVKFDDAVRDARGAGEKFENWGELLTSELEGEATWRRRKKMRPIFLAAISSPKEKAI
jgi:hypothetical protein